MGPTVSPVKRVLDKSVDRVVGAWADQIRGARFLGLKPQLLFVNPKDFGVWARGTAWTLMEDSAPQFGGVELVVLNRVPEGEAWAVADHS